MKNLINIQPVSSRPNKERCKKDIFQCENIYKFNFNEYDGNGNGTLVLLADIKFGVGKI